MDEVDTMQRFNGELYQAILTGNKKKVLDLCQRVPDHALHIVSINDDTILHMAIYAKEADIALKLIDDLPDHLLHKLICQNIVGNTILHEAATSDRAVPVADKLLRIAPGLLGMRNYNGETALFRAAQHGKADIFNFLAAKLSGYGQASLQFYLQRSDKTTVLHIAILSGHFDLAWKIANDYEYLVGEKDSDDMTSLQLLSCDPSAFKLELEVGFLHIVKLYCNSTWRGIIQKRKQKYQTAVKLAKFLIRKDTSWENTSTRIDQGKPKIHKYGVIIETGGQESINRTLRQREDHVGKTPLLLATKSGCLEIVEEILRIYPQAVEQVDDEGRNILHVAIKYRRLEIFELVKKMEVPRKKLARKIDNKGNTILHTVSIKRSDFVPEKMEGPAFELQDESRWFERVKEVIPAYLMYHQNHMNYTADAYFTTSNSELRSSAKEWLKSTSEGSTVVAVLIATVAFAAAYTVPGGPNQSTGVPVLVNQPFFTVFTVTDVLSLAFALTAVVTFLSILSSPFRFEDFQHTLPNKLIVGFTFLFLSVAMMMVAFGATIVLMIHSRESWTKIALYTVSFIPVGIFALSYFPLYSSLSKTYTYLLKNIRQALALSSQIIIPQKMGNFSNYCHPQATDSSFP